MAARATALPESESFANYAAAGSRQSENTSASTQANQVSTPTKVDGRQDDAPPEQPQRTPRSYQRIQIELRDAPHTLLDNVDFALRSLAIPEEMLVDDSDEANMEPLVKPTAEPRFEEYVCKTKRKYLWFVHIIDVKVYADH